MTSGRHAAVPGPRAGGVEFAHVMSDFHQSGPVTALPRLRAQPIEELEARVEGLPQRLAVSLVVPMVPGDGPAGAGDDAGRALSRPLPPSLVVSLNRADAGDYARTCRYFEPYSGRVVVLWNESPAVQRFFVRLAQVGLGIGTPGKGRACWLALGYLLADADVDYVAFQDADVVNYQREMLAA